MKINFNQQMNKESLKIAFAEHKDYLYPTLAILISIFLFFIILLPQILSFPAKKSQVDTEEKKLNEFVTAKDLVGTINSTSLNNDLLLSSQALPTDKDYTSMINAISSAANSTNTTIKDYRFILSGVGTSKTQLSASSIPSVILQMSLSADVSQTIAFIKELYSTVPISEVSSINYGASSSQITINFFYKPLPSADINNSELIRKRTAEEEEIFNNISAWKLPESTAGNIIIVPASESAIPSNSPF